MGRRRVGARRGQPVTMSPCWRFAKSAARCTRTLVGWTCSSTARGGAGRPARRVAPRTREHARQRSRGQRRAAAHSPRGGCGSSWPVQRVRPRRVTHDDAGKARVRCCAARRGTVAGRMKGSRVAPAPHVPSGGALSEAFACLHVSRPARVNLRRSLGLSAAEGTEIGLVCNVQRETPRAPPAPKRLAASPQPCGAHQLALRAAARLNVQRRVVPELTRGGAPQCGMC